MLEEIFQFGHIRGKKGQWLGNFSEQRDLHFFSVEKDFLKLEKIWDRSMDFVPKVFFNAFLYAGIYGISLKPLTKS